MTIVILLGLVAGILLARHGNICDRPAAGARWKADMKKRFVAVVATMIAAVVFAPLPLMRAPRSNVPTREAIPSRTDAAIAGRPHSGPDAHLRVDYLQYDGLGCAMVPIAIERAAKADPQTRVGLACLRAVARRRLRRAVALIKVTGNPLRSLVFGRKTLNASLARSELLFRACSFHSAHRARDREM